MDNRPTVSLIGPIASPASGRPAARIGLGTDFFPADTRFPEELLSYYKRHIIELGFDREAVEAREIAAGLGEFTTYEEWPALRRAVEDRFPATRIRGILGENFLRFWERAV